MSAFSYEELPEKVASHFDLDGRANGWMSRTACVDFTIGLAVFIPAFVIGLMACAGRIPVSFMNLPHRDFWMAPERRTAAWEILFRYALWLASLIVLFVAGAHALIVNANRPDGEAHLSNVGLIAIVGSFLAGTALWVCLLMRKFSKLP